MQRVERAQNRGDLASHEALRLRAPFLQPGAEVAVDRVLESDAVAHAAVAELDEPIEHLECARLPEQKLGEIRFAQPRRDPVGDLDADLQG